MLEMQGDSLSSLNGGTDGNEWALLVYSLSLLNLSPSSFPVHLRSAYSYQCCQGTLPWK